MMLSNLSTLKPVALKLAVRAMMALAVSFFPHPVLTSGQHIPYGISDIVDITHSNSRILVHHVYSTPERNFLHEDVYGDLDTGFLRREVAEMLSRAQDLLESKKKDMRHIECRK